VRSRTAGSRDAVAAGRLDRPALALSLPVALAGALLTVAILATAAAHSEATHGAAGARRALRQQPAAGVRRTSQRASALPPLRYRPIGCEAKGLNAVYSHGQSRREVALSFDDGPATLTPRFVQMLRANGAVATFFLVGERVSPRYRATLREELREGDALGDHSWSHPDLVLSHEVAGQLKGTREAIRRETGYTPCVFRPPYGAYDAQVVGAARPLRLATILWDVDPVDWSLPGVSAIERRVLAQVQPGSIVLSHDGGGPRGQTLGAYPYIIRALRARGYRFVTIPQLLGFRTVYRICRLRCEGTAIRGRPPRGSIVERG
jgi:peptidoglycan-N-acetylglucosamine deacetylase